MSRRLLPILCVLLGALAGASPGLATSQDLTLTMSDGVALACTFQTPGGAKAPAVMIFHGLGGTRQTMAPFAADFGAHGYATLACDARAHGQSGGLFGLDGPRDVQDTKELFAWLAARPEVDGSAIGAFGASLGGGAVWNAAAAGVPFKAIVPVITWTDLLTALAPQGLAKSGLVTQLALLVPTSRWDPQLLAAQQGLITSKDLTAARALAGARSVTSALPRITIPTMLIQGRHDFLFDVDQALSAYRSLGGPRRLYLGDFGHLPDQTEGAPDAAYLTTQARTWFDRFLRGLPNGIDTQPSIELAHDPWNGTTTSFRALPPTTHVVLAVGGKQLIAPGGKLARSFMLKGGAHETFGDTVVTAHVTRTGAFDHLVAELRTPTTIVSAGGVPLPPGTSTVHIRLMNESVLVRRGQRVTLLLGASTQAVDPTNALYLNDVASGSATVSRISLSLSLLRKPVSR